MKKEGERVKEGIKKKLNEIVKEEEIEEVMKRK